MCQRNSARVSSGVETGSRVDSSSRAEGVDGSRNIKVVHKAQLVSGDGSSIGSRSVPSKSQVFARGDDLNCRSVRLARRTVDSSSCYTSATGIASFHSDSVRSSISIFKTISG